ncbi:MAG: hypothetical protein Q4D29_04475 [Lachnospiraceae bacterium]|nr:hypothetical protein [Lachnospiraceae bacterium]
MKQNLKANFHLPGLFEFYDFYKIFLPVFYENREFFYDFCDIGSIYGAPSDCIFGGGRIENSDNDPNEILSLLQKYNISARLTFSNSLISEEHLSDKRCNELLKIFAGDDEHVQNGIIIYSDILLKYIKENYNGFYFISTTTKVITDFDDFSSELNREEFKFVVPDFRLNKQFDKLEKLSFSQKEKTEFLVNECCDFACTDRKACYENVSRKALFDNVPDHVCGSKDAASGYMFSKAMKNKGFISIEDIKNIYMPMGFSNFKIEGRSLGSALILEFILYYMTKPEYVLNVREKIYLDNSLDLF